MSELLSYLLDDSGFMPHGMCLLWRPDLLSLHVFSDGLISLSYFSIPAFLFVVARRRGDPEFRPIFYRFSAFILLCGLTHAFNIVTFWDPLYLESGLVKLATGIVSASTALALWRGMPTLLAIPSNTMLREANARLEHEVAERNRTQDQLARSNRILQDAISTMSDGFALYDAEERLVTCNLVYKRLLDRSAQTLEPGTSFETVFRSAVYAGQYALPRGGAEHWLAARLEAVRGGAGELEQELTDGRWVLMKERRTADGGTVSIFTEITGQKRAVRILEEGEERFRSAFETAPHGMALVSPDGRWLKANGALCDMLGYDDQELLGRDVKSIVHPDDLDAIAAYLRRMLAGRPPEVQSERRYIHKDGRIVWILMSASLIRDSEGKPLYFVQQMIDLTERKETAAQLLQAQKMEAVGQLTGGIAHDFNNLLTIILGSARILERRLPDGDPLTEYLQAISAAVRRGADLTRRLLTFSRKQELRVQAVDARRLVGGMLDLLRRTLGETIEIETRFVEGELLMRTDPTLLETALLNLATNARDAMPEGGVLTVALDRARGDGTLVEDAGAGYVVLTVSDTGSGIPEDQIDRIFEPFFTTKEVGKGTGLGLSLVFGFVEQSGGFVRVNSKVGEGTSFRLYLKRAEASELEQPAARPGRVGAAARAPGTVLVVEDEPDVRRVAVAIVGELGHRVLQAANGPDALERLVQNPQVDLLFTDVVMPGGMTGYELAEIALERRPGLKVLFTSGYADDVKPSKGLADVEARTIRKPYRDLDLAERIADALAEAG